MSISNNNATKIKTENKLQQIRATRFDELTSIYNLKLKHNEESLSIQDISDSGLKVLCNGNSFSQNEVLDLNIYTNQGNLVHNGSGRVAWVNEVDGNFYAGIEFRDKMLPKGFLKSLDKLLAVEVSVTEQFNNFLALPESFRSLVFEIKHFLSHLKEEVDKLEDEMIIESLETKNSVLSALDVRFGEYIQKQLIEYSNKLFQFAKETANKKDKQLYYAFFRKELNQYYLQSPYARRALEKPQGYAGDFEMMDQVYRNDYEGASLFAKLIHRYTVNEHAAQSVRQRRLYLKSELTQYLQSVNGKKNSIHICSVASGPAREIVDLLRDFPEISISEINITLLDQDIESLLDARRNILSSTKQMHIPVNLRCLPISVKSILENSHEAQEFFDCEYDFIYTAGLYDYLMDPVATMLSQIIYSKLKNNGTFLIGNFHPDTPTRAICEFSVDWQLIYRDEHDMDRLSKAVMAKDYEISLDELGFVVYTKFKK